MKDDLSFTKTIELLKELPEIDAITLGGSKSTNKSDIYSDYDVYIYLNCDLSSEKRADILAKTNNYLEINNTYWETEDNCILKSGICIDFIYRTIETTTKHLRNILINHEAFCGYSTCMCSNIFTSKILFDSKNLYKNMIENFTIPYPEKLRQNIILKNRGLLNGKIPSYIYQIEKAIDRNDMLSVNHRITEFLASYFDIIFAFNKIYHPGEKRLIQLSMELCDFLPKDFQSDISNLITAKNDNNIILLLQKLIDNLDDLLGTH